MKAKKGVVKLPPKLTKTQEDLLWHMQHGYQLETGSLQDGPLLRRLKDDKLIRTTSAKLARVAVRFSACTSHEAFRHNRNMLQRLRAGFCWSLLEFGRYW